MGERRENGGKGWGEGRENGGERWGRVVPCSNELVTGLRHSIDRSVRSKRSVLP